MTTRSTDLVSDFNIKCRYWSKVDIFGIERIMILKVAARSQICSF